MADPEKYTGSVERTSEIEKAAAERSAELRERAAEVLKDNEKQAEKEVNEARAEANKEAKAAKEQQPKADQEKANDVGASGFSRNASYKQTMKNIQKDMSAPSRVFSKVIHNKIVEEVSDTIASTVARPNAILSGAVCAFVLVLGLYWLAKHMGFALYGSETIAAFIIGWLLGLLFDMFRTFFKRRS